MDWFLEMIADGVLAILGKVVRHSEKRTQSVVDILVAVIAILAVDGYAIWRAIDAYRRGNMLGAVLYSAALVVSVLLLAFVVIRRIIRKRKAKKEPSAQSDRVGRCVFIHKSCIGRLWHAYNACPTGGCL